MINVKTIFLALAFISVAILLVLGLGNTGSIDIKLQENGYVPAPPQTGTFTLEGNSGTYETAWLGVLTSQSGVTLSNNNDGDLTIENTLEDGNPLKLYSRITSVGGNMFGTETNYIEAKVKLPAGKLEVNYAYDLKDYYGNQAEVSFNIDGVKKSFKTKTWSKAERGGTLSGNDVYTFELDREKEVTFRIETTLASKLSNAEGGLVIYFEPAQSETSNPLDPENKPGVQKLTLTQRINNWIQNFIDKIFNWRPELI